ncbi:hypothetical protein IVB25_23530 [Bradyrhizobium sp. 193]|uniref:hypothetical protein n=1 Tax=Bradyrhizobium sp. 193 TaxID=2782661 RepID=UPI001FFA2785|nr:hypothetical protein [Bradyrhizobium sp. 193]MCK1485581.1 hypothetical protein [Bradyrhizobium sp. 193]
MNTMNVTEAADYAGASVSYLNKRRVYGGGPLYMKVGRRVIYDREHLNPWLSNPNVTNTSQRDVEAP